jgi:hypothetical protein
MFSSAAIKYHQDCARAGVAKTMVTAIAANVTFNVARECQTLESTIAMFVTADYAKASKETDPPFSPFAFDGTTLRRRHTWSVEGLRGMVDSAITTVSYAWLSSGVANRWECRSL